MALETALTYVIALGLPLWLVIEELLHWTASPAPARARRDGRLPVHRAELIGPETA